MVFFKPKPNLPDAEKARIEYHFQQLAECIGFDRFRLPVLRRQMLIDQWQSHQDAPQMIRYLGEQLDHDTSGIRLDLTRQQQAASCSGGG